jgi:YVTN family beta-propeller protein
MSLRESSSPARARHRLITAGAAALVLASGATAFLTTHHSAGAGSPASHPAASQRRPAAARLTAESCSGPAGAAYVAEAGYSAFAAINTANCDILQTYNVGDPQVPGDPGDYNYSSTAEGLVLVGSTLYIADAGGDNVGIIDTSTLNVSDYNPPGEVDVHVGFVPTYVTANPAGTQVWVADTGPQTSPASPSGISILSTATNKVTGQLKVPGGPQQIAFSPDGSRAYVTTAQGLVVVSTRTLHVITVIKGLGDPHAVAVSPDGKTAYVTNTVQGLVEVISTATDRVTGTIRVGQLPWDIVISADGSTMYVANGNSESVSVISTATRKVTGTITLQGDPDTMALTPDGSQLWVGSLTFDWIFAYSTSTLAEVGAANLGAPYPQGGDGDEPTGIVLTGTPSPDASSAVKAPLNVPGAKSSTSSTTRN